jgi:hypothetical protein
MKRSFLPWFVLGIFVFLFGLTVAGNAENYSTTKAVFEELKADYPGVRIYEEGGFITRVYGRAFGSGSGPVDAAEQFKENYAGLFNVGPDELNPESILFDGRHTQPVMNIKDTGEYKFTLVYYSQYRDEIPVFRSDLRLLVRNEPGYPLVLAASALRDLTDFTVPAGVTANPALARSAAMSFSSGLDNVSEPRLTIWAGINDMEVAPAVAMEITADNGMEATQDYEKWLLLVDAFTGEILYSEDLILDVDVTGNVSGMATDSSRADICDPEEPTPLPYARVYIQGGSTVYADENGDFVIPNDGDEPVTVISNIRGEWFRVFNSSGGDAQLSDTVTPPGPINFLHNEENTSEYNRAEVNAYVHSNVVRDFTLAYCDTFPVIDNQTGFRVNVNISQNCNAFYDGYSINFYTSGGGCPNTAFSTVVHHEYGHHLVNVGGSGQGQYGEGMGDVMGVLITDDPHLAYGWNINNCDGYMRSADNNFQYPCSGEIHYCGQLISGCVWSTRNELEITNPDDYIDIISNLVVNSILVHQGDMITPSITIDYLTLDDDDGNIWNGTPHGMEIITGFAIAHNMDPGIGVQIVHTPLVDIEDSTATLAVYADVTSFFSMEDGSVSAYYTTGGEFTEIEMVNTSGDTYYGEIPTPPYETTVSYYIEGIDGTGQSATAPENAPDSLYSFFFGTDVIPPTITFVEGPPNTVNLFGPYGPFIIIARDNLGIDESEVILHYRVNDEAESEIALEPTYNEDEYGLDWLDLERQLNSGDIVNYYFTALDEAGDPNMGRLPESGDFELLMADAETFEDFEEFGIDRWITEGAWMLSDQHSHSGDYSMVFSDPSYPNNADDLAYMDFGYDLSPYTAASITIYHKNLIRPGDTCFVVISGDGGQAWTTVGSITGLVGPGFVFNEFDISPALNPNDHDYRVGFRFVSDASDNWAGLFLDDIGWGIGPMTGVDEFVAELPTELSLNQNYPNPFNPQTNISFALANDSHVSLDVYDLLGRRVVRLIDEKMNVGSYTITWDGRDAVGNEISSGIYFYRLSTEQGVRQEKMTLLR